MSYYRTERLKYDFCNTDALFDRNAIYELFVKGQWCYFDNTNVFPENKNAMK